MKTFRSRVPIECIEHEVATIHCDESEATTNAPRTEAAIEAFNELLKWVMEPAATQRTLKLRSIGARFIALAYAINPALINNRTMQQIQRETRGQVKQPNISKLVRKFEAEFGFRSSGGHK